MKSARKSTSTETRNARKMVTSHGASRSLSPALSQSRHLLSSRRLRRAARDSARIEVFVMTEEGEPYRPTIAIDIDSYVRTILGSRITEA